MIAYTLEVAMNTHIVLRTVNLKPFMQKYPFCQETGAAYSHLEQVIQSGEVALHLIDGKVQINVLEALRALAKFKTGRSGRATRYGNFAQLIEQFEQNLPQTDTDLFA
jgi:hypothetical protein